MIRKYWTLYCFSDAKMPLNRFKREKREVTPFSEDPVVPEEIPAEWRHVEAPPNFTWVGQDELAGMGWPKSRDQVISPVFTRSTVEFQTKITSNLGSLMTCIVYEAAHFTVNYA